MRDGDNPCNICPSKDDCEGCILKDLVWDSGECHNYSCFLNYECGCLLSLDAKCKASTAYKCPGCYVMNGDMEETCGNCNHYREGVCQHWEEVKDEDDYCMDWEEEE